MTFCGPARDTVLTNRQAEKLNFDTNYITITFKRLSKDHEYFIEYKEIKVQHLFVCTTFVQDYNRTSSECSWDITISIQGVPKNPKTIEIHVLLEFECLSTLLNPHVHQSLT